MRNDKRISIIRATARLLISLCFTATVSCGTATQKNTGDQGDARGRMEYAHCLRMYDEHGYTVVEISPSSDSESLTSQYILLPDSVLAPMPDNNVAVIPVPLTKAVVYTSVHADALEELGKTDIIKGVADAGYFHSDKIRFGLESEEILNIGPSSSPSHEKIIHLAPQVIILNTYDGMEMRGVDKLGIPVLSMAENLENTPLGRAEWIKLFGRLTGKAAIADSIFDEVKNQYLALSKQQSASESRPKIMTETMYEGIWYVSAGDSYQARLIKDAGGVYPWAAANGTGSLNLSFEQVLDKCADADIWLLRLIHPNFRIKDLINLDSRYANFKPVKTGGVWYADSGSSDLFEHTTWHPDELLSDYIAIFSGHPSDAKYFKNVKP